MVMWPLILAIGAAALLLLMLGVMLWRHADSGERRAASSAFLEQQLGRQRDGPAGSDPVAVAASAAGRSGYPWWDKLMARAGVRSSVGFYLGMFAPAVVIPIALLAVIGPFAAFGALVVLAGVSAFRIWLKIDRRQRRMLAQLPGFLESMVRLLTIGSSLGAAFQTAAGNVNEPLREVLARAESLTRSGKDLDDALRQVSEQYGLRQLFLLSSVIAVAMRFGGRTDQILDRMAAFMRDIEQARDELSALSAEVRMSAWILALLPLGLTAFIIMFNNALFMSMWNDPVGINMLIVAVVLQASGCFWLYRMARSV